MSMQAGEYYIGDLCYVMHDVWDEVARLPIDDTEMLGGEFTLADGRRLAFYGTPHGDGDYRASNGARLMVDSGTVGCIRVEDIRDNLTRTEIEEAGTVVQFSSEFGTWSDDGEIRFGRISVTEEELDDEEVDEALGWLASGVWKQWLSTPQEKIQRQGFDPRGKRDEEDLR